MTKALTKVHCIGIDDVGHETSEGLAAAVEGVLIDAMNELGG